MRSSPIVWMRERDVSRTKIGDRLVAVTSLTRREALKVLGAAVATASAGCGSDDSGAAPPPRFFTDDERRAVDALAGVVLPSEAGSPGAAELGVSAFLERLLTAFEQSPPALFADGPYSDRNFVPDGKGSSAGDVPPNDFRRFQTIDRVTERAWRIALYGSRAEGATWNEGAVPDVVGLRDLFRDGVRAAMASSKVPLETLSPDDLHDAFDALDRSLQEAFIDLVPQAAFGAPEYGGNPDGAGWALAHFEGDNQPFGYSIYDARSDRYYERVDRPMSQPDPGPDPAPMDEGTQALLAEVVAVTDGKVFR